MSLQFIPYLICSKTELKKYVLFVLQGEKGSIGPPGESGTSGPPVSTFISNLLQFPLICTTR